MPAPAAAAVAIVSRFIVTIIDVLAALGGWLYARSHHLVSERRARDRRRARPPTSESQTGSSTKTGMSRSVLRW